MELSKFPSVDLHSVPFSRFGSYFAISDLNAMDGLPAGLYLRTVHGSVNRRQIFRIETLDGDSPVPYQARLRPDALALVTAAGSVTFCIDEPDRLRMRGSGAGLRLTMQTALYDYLLPVAPGAWHLNSFTHYLKFMMRRLAGAVTVDAPWSVDYSQQIVITCQPDSSGAFEICLDEYQHDPRPDLPAGTFEEGARRAGEDFLRFYEQAPDGAPPFEAARMLAAYVNWASVVGSQGHLRRPTMFMSKNWMTNIWAWDHCFNAMSLAEKNPELAWDQFNLLFDQQAPSGLIPDFYNDARLCWNYTKPPVHGWALRRMMAVGAVTTGQLAEIYPKLVAWTEWWFRERDSDGDGIPEYYHGNDSGWDNATVFSIRPPVESPDLPAFLVLQMDVLAEVAARLGRPEEHATWKARAGRLLEALLAHSWRDGRFVAPRSGAHDWAGKQSLILLMPIVLGELLPEQVRAALVQQIREGGYLTDYGLATEAPSSPHYEPDGYWRGPIWAPPTLIVVDGLLRCGETGLAREIAEKFCRLVAQSGMAENFDALTGAPRRDLAYTWTSSVFLLLNQVIGKK